MEIDLLVEMYGRDRVIEGIKSLVQKWAAPVGVTVTFGGAPQPDVTTVPSAPQSQPDVTTVPEPPTAPQPDVTTVPSAPQSQPDVTTVPEPPTASSVPEPPTASQPDAASVPSVPEPPTVPPKPKASRSKKNNVAPEAFTELVTHITTSKIPMEKVTEACSAFGTTFSALMGADADKIPAIMELLK